MLCVYLKTEKINNYVFLKFYLYSIIIMIIIIPWRTFMNEIDCKVSKNRIILIVFMY